MSELSTTKKSRIDFIDLAKGFCIILVVFHHYCAEDLGVYHPINMFFRTFRMPLYFILSGLFFKRYDGFFNFTLRKTNKLLIPFFFFFSISAFLAMLRSHQWDFFGYLKNVSLGVWNETITGNTPIWFLWCLFLNNIIFYLLELLSSQQTKYSVLSLSCASILCGVIGYTLGINEINLPAFLDSALTTTPFFAFGYLLRKYTNILYPNRYDKYLPLQVIIYFALVVLFGGYPLFFSNNMQECNILSLYLCGIAGSLGILAFSKLLHQLPVITTLGRYSIIILCTHIIPRYYIYLADSFWNRTGISSKLFIDVLYLTGIIAIEYFLIIPLFKKYLPYVTAQKDLIPVEQKKKDSQ